MTRIMERLHIERLGHHGDGIAPGPVYVPGTLPGEEVEGEVAGGVVKSPRIITPSPQRVTPPCRHAKACGGCQLQHAADGFVTSWKEDVVRRALDAQGLTCEMRATVTSPERSRRRAGFSARRTKRGALAGFHQKSSDVTVRGGKPVDDALRPELATIAQQEALARLAWDDEVLTLLPPHQRFGAALVVPPPGAFLQATAAGQAALLAGVQEAVEGAGHVADLFAGCGTFALPLAEQALVHAVESDAAMLDALDKGWRMSKGLKQVTHAARDLFRNPLLPDELSRFDAVVIDPPRAGAEAQVAEIARARVPRLAHVSCNPVTFAREAAQLVAAGYRLDWVQVVDQFRWSTHVEMVAAFRLED